MLKLCWATYLLYITITAVRSDTNETKSQRNILVVSLPVPASHKYITELIAMELISQGAHITQMNFNKQSCFTSHPSIETITVKLNNSVLNSELIDENGEIVTDRKALWESSNWWRTFRNMPLRSYGAVADVLCDAILSDEDLYQLLESRNFSVALVDLMFNECTLALLHQLDIPVVGYWGGGMLNGYETIAMRRFVAPGSYPAFMSHVTDLTKWTERFWNSMVLFFEIVTTSYMLQVTHTSIQVCSSGCQKKLFARFHFTLLVRLC